MCSEWFQSLRNKICNEIEALEESTNKFKKEKNGQETQTV